MKHIQQKYNEHFLCSAEQLLMFNAHVCSAFENLILPLFISFVFNLSLLYIVIENAHITIDLVDL